MAKIKSTRKKNTLDRNPQKTLTGKSIEDVQYDQFKKALEKGKIRIVVEFEKPKKKSTKK